MAGVPTACQQWTGTSVGGVLADNDGRILFYFGHVVDKELVATWGPPDGTQHIFEAEVLPYALGSYCLGCYSQGMLHFCIH